METLLEYIALNEGVRDPGILKAVFLAGGPGSGKSYVGNVLFGIDAKFKQTWSTYGLKLVNSDPIFELLLHKGGIDPKKLADISANDPELWDKITQSPTGPRKRAQVLSKKQQALYMGGKLGLIIDGTGDNIEKIGRQKGELEDAGYDTMMVFVNTRLDVALARNRARARSLPDDLVKEIWHAAQKNLEFFDHLFEHFHVVNNNDPEPPSAEIQRKVRSFVTSPVVNPRGREWMAVADAVKTLV